MIIRRRFWDKLAQTIPTEQVAATKLTSAPTIMVSRLYPNIRTGFNAAQVIIIDSLVNKLNVALHMATGGAYNLQILKNKSWIFDPSSFPSPDQKNLILFFAKVYHGLLNNGNAFKQPLAMPELTVIVNNLVQAVELKNLSQINPIGPIAQKISANLRGDIKNDLARLISGPVKMV